jgi:ABC-type transport system involved in multi-copper enzyme maturation permease subunit
VFKEIFRFELRQQLRNPFYWVVSLAFGSLAFAVATSDHVQIGGGIGNTHRNAPYVIVEMLANFTILGMFLVTVFVAGAALRDFEAGTAELLFATPLSRKAYLGGRFAAGYLASLGIFVFVALGLLIGVLMPWVDPARLGPTSLLAYGYGFAVMVLPGLFFVSALLFLLAIVTRSMLGVYIGVIGFFVLWLVAVTVTGASPDRLTLGALIDPFGIGAFEVVTRYWTAADRNTRLPEVAGLLLGNRILWSAVGASLLWAAFACFRTDREGLRFGRRRARVSAAIADLADRDPGDRDAAVASRGFAAPAVVLRSDPAARWAQFLWLARFETRAVLLAIAFLVMLAFGLVNLGASLAFSNEMFGTKVFPVTHLMMEAMDGSYNFLLFIVVAFYAGELVWRERAARISDVTDAFPLADWIPLAGKLTALAAVIVIFLSAGSVECALYQLIRGHHRIEPGLYAANIALTALKFLLLAALALFLQVIANNKFRGYLLIVLFLISRIVLKQLNFEHHLYDFGSAPETPYSDMNGYGHFLAGHLWFSAYWACLAVALLVLAALYWVRGTAQGWRERARIARARCRTPSRIALGLSLAAFLSLGTWIFYNTNVLNRYVPEDLAKERKADYEKRYRRYKDLPQPRIVDERIDIDIYPAERHVDVRGHYRLANRDSAPIRDLHVLLPVEMELVAAQFAPHDLITDDRMHGYSIYRLAAPLAPGASMDFDFTLRYRSQGFRNKPNDTHVAENGTFIDNRLFPHFGYSEEGQLEDRNDRRHYGLGPVPRMAKIDDLAARRNSLVCCDSDWVTFETTISTPPDQIALAPGYLEKEWTANGRRYFHYRMDKPTLGFFSFQSARYAVKRDRWQDVALEVYYDPQHEYNVARMLEAMKKSLAHFSAAYSPYQFRQLRILEFPGYERFAQSFANTVPFSESIGFIADLRDPNDIDYVFYVTAHEVAHQWWAHQVIGAKVQGVTMLDETFAQYSALMLQEHEYGSPQMHRFLKYELDRYLTGRSGETVEEMPLALVENQPYIHYRKGSLVMYALKDYLGEDLVDRTLRRFDHEFAFQPPPYPTTNEFFADLAEESAPGSTPLVDDLFHRITLFDNRMVEATATRRADGRYDVHLRVHAAKLYADGTGKETPAHVTMPIDIGVFARGADGTESTEKVLYLAKHPLPDGDTSLTVTVDGRPYQAGIDPYNKLIDRVPDDNRAKVTIEN